VGLPELLEHVGAVPPGATITVDGRSVPRGDTMTTPEPGQPAPTPTSQQAGMADPAGELAAPTAAAGSSADGPALDPAPGPGEEDLPDATPDPQPRPTLADHRPQLEGDPHAWVKAWPDVRYREELPDLVGDADADPDVEWQLEEASRNPDGSLETVHVWLRYSPGKPFASLDGR
jgi:hypothetical protein